MTELKKRKIIAKELEKEPDLWLAPDYWSLNFLREWKDHLPPRDHHYWKVVRPENEEQIKIWKEFGPKDE